MARKTTGTTTRSKKTVNSAPPAAVQTGSEVVKNGKTANPAILNAPTVKTPVNVPVNIEEQIRVRAYELYLERRATAGSANGSGNENQDWLIAEREILSRHNGPDHHA